MKRIITTLALAATMVLATASVALAGEPPANAGSPTCAGMDLGSGPLGNHADHIKGDYVNPGEPGGAMGGPGHFDHGPEVGPGASFCLAQAQGESPLRSPQQITIDQHSKTERLPAIPGASPTYPSVIAVVPKRSPTPPAPALSRYYVQLQAMPKLLVVIGRRPPEVVSGGPGTNR